nr:N-6 DNA methylase [Anaerolineaceae bacterium]
SDFTLLWLLAHQSRFEAAGGESANERTADCWLERWSKSAQEQGTRALEDLRRGVEEAIGSLGQGFLRHPLNGDLKARLKKGDLSTQDFYRQILRLVYRLIFLFVAEDRDLLAPPGASETARERYYKYYSTSRLRDLSVRQRGSRHHDLYEGLRQVMTLLGSAEGCPELAIPALGGFLFDPRTTADLNTAALDNQALLSAVRALAFITEGRTRRAVDFCNLGSEELGSVYESLLELHPLVNMDAGTFELSSAAGNERKTTGSYYTPTSLIQVLLDSALDPVVEDRLKGKKDAAEQEQALLGLKVCDPACGSGHFLIAAAHRIAGRLARVRAGGDEPTPLITRGALRDVIRHCLYGVDLNPMAVELCKVNLWLESLEPGKPLSFLDAHIKCGNSLVGVGPGMDIHTLEVPDKAFNEVTGDHKPTAALLKKRNKQEGEGQESLFVTVMSTKEDLERWLAERARSLEAMPEDSPAEVQAKAEAYQRINTSDEYRRQKQTADLWTAAFFWKIEAPAGSSLEVMAPTQGQLRRLRQGGPLQAGLMEQVAQISQREGFFHWTIEFAEMAAQGGFDCILGNPPWERIKLQEEEFFAQRDPEIAGAPNKAARQKLIDQLSKHNPALALAFEAAKHGAECSSKFMRHSLRFRLTAVGDVNTYALFAEHARDLTGKNGRSGIILPTGIATDDTTKEFFGDLVEKRSIASLFDFENREAIFPGVHRSYKFCLLTLSGAPISQAQFIFFATRVGHLRDERRRFTLAPEEIALFNPNTHTMPVFRTRMDAELTRKIYQRVPVLVNEQTGENPWGVSFLAMFHMSNDSGLFVTEPREGYVRLYEAKMFWHYDHRWNTYDQEETRDLTISEKKNPAYFANSRYWVSEKEVDNKLGETSKKWLIGFRDITNATNERTSIFTFIPKTAVGNNAPLLLLEEKGAGISACIVANLCCLVFDFPTRHKVGGTHINFFIAKQLPVLPPTYYTLHDIHFIASRVVELVYTANDMQPFVQDILDEFGVKTWNEWYPDARLNNSSSLPNPFCWDEGRRALLRAELDAYYARLYGLTRDELRYILDPQDVYGPDFPGETFRVLKEKEIRQYGEYRTRRLVLEAWDRLEGEMANGEGRMASGGERPKVLVLPVAVEKPAEPAQARREPSAAGGEAPAAPVKKTPAEKPAAQQPELQPMLSDFGLYKCGGCGKLVVGYDRDYHVKTFHAGKKMEWTKR